MEPGTDVSLCVCSSFGKYKVSCFESRTQTIGSVPFRWYFMTGSHIVAEFSFPPRWILVRLHQTLLIEHIRLRILVYVIDEVLGKCLDDLELRISVEAHCRGTVHHGVQVIEIFLLRKLK